MARRISLITSTLVGALAVACVPGGGDSGGADSAPTDMEPGHDLGPEAGTEFDSGRPADVSIDAVANAGSDAASMADDGVDTDRGQPGIIELGASCGPPPGCEPAAPDWPDCIDRSCAFTGDCQRPMLADDYGYCTQPCTEAADCAEVTEGGPYGRAYVCLTDGESGRCVPGSGEPCALAASPQCTEDEVCRWGIGYVRGEDFGPTCQTPTEGGAATGEPCDEERGLRCANDMCLFGVCTALCDPSAPTPPGLCPADWGCFDDFDIGVEVDLCLPNYCETDGDCGDGSTCVLGFEFNSDEVLRGLCLPTDTGSAQPGEPCSDARPCQSSTCLDGPDGGYCAGLCQEDEDCGPDAYCDLIYFGIDAEPGRAPAKICRPGARSGSGRACTHDAECAADGQAPDEACEYVVRGDLEAGRLVGPLRLDGRCAAIPAGAVAEGEACSDDTPCRTESLCLNGGGQTFCSAACRDSADCGGGLCFAIEFGDGLPGGVCVPPALLGAEGSSVASCTRDADCPDPDEACRVNIVGTMPPVAETICANDGGAGAAGARCVEDDDCAALDCAPLPEGGDYCRAPCSEEADCGEGFTCAVVVPEPGAGELMLCQPGM